MAMRLLPIAACTAGTLYFGNIAYLSLSVAFIQILKVYNMSIICPHRLLADVMHEPCTTLHANANDAVSPRMACTKLNSTLNEGLSNCSPRLTMRHAA